MGGFGSGRRPRAQKIEAESALDLDMRELSKLGRLKEGYQGTISWSSQGTESGKISFKYIPNVYYLEYLIRHGEGEWEKVSQPINIVTTPCNFGGERKWWVCGACQKKKLVLYLGRKYFYCRECHRVSYFSQGYDEKRRLQARAAKIKASLGIDNSWDLDRDVYGFDKPKGMHSRTFNRLKTKANRYLYESRTLWDLRLEAILKNHNHFGR